MLKCIECGNEMGAAMRPQTDHAHCSTRSFPKPQRFLLVFLPSIGHQLLDVVGSFGSELRHPSVKPAGTERFVRTMGKKTRAAGITPPVVNSVIDGAMLIDHVCRLVAQAEFSDLTIIADEARV